MTWPPLEPKRDYNYSNEYLGNNRFDELLIERRRAESIKN
jgi:hypothetical protein